MPLIKPKPSLNHQVIKNMTKQEVIDLHPGSDEDHISAEWDKATDLQGDTVDVSKGRKKAKE